MKKRIALLLILALALSLAACGGGGGEDGETADGGGAIVYEPETVSVTSELERLEGWCLTGEGAYLLCLADSRMDTPLTLLRVPEGGGELEPLPDYQPVMRPEDVSHWGLRLQAGAGGLWEAQQAYSLPGGETLTTLRRLDGEGRELSRLELGAQLEEALDAGTVRDLIVDGEGRVLIQCERGFAMLDQAGEVLFTLPTDGFRMDTGNLLVALGDGRVGAVTAWSPGAGGGGAVTVRTVDLKKEVWDDSFPINGSAISPFSGGDGALFYYLNGSTLHVWRPGAEAGEPLLNITDACVDAVSVGAVAGRSGGGLALLCRELSRGPDSVQLVRLTPTDAASTERKVLTLAAIQSYTDLEKAVAAFNRTNREYRVSLTDYSQYGGYGAGLTRLITEINAGKAPDLLATNGLPADQWAESGLLEDLWPYIDGDGEIRREDLMIRPLEAAERDGKLYEIAGSFKIVTLVGRRDVVGDRMRWTKEDMMAALEKMPAGCAPYAYGSRTELLDTLLDWSKLVDRAAGTCDFEGETFRSLLEFCASMPEGDPDALRLGAVEGAVYEGRQMLLKSTRASFSFGLPAQAEALLGGEIAYVGYPDAWGGVGSWFALSDTDAMAMTAACRDKEGAWAFLRTLLLPREDLGNWLSSFPINRRDFEYMAEEAIAAGPDGEEKPASGAVTALIQLEGYDDPLRVKYSMTREQYDRLMALYNAIERSGRADPSLEEIVHTAAGAYFAGDTSLDDAVRSIQSRAELYLGELG